MTKIQQKILIYTDFSEVGQKSIEWGIFLAKKIEKNILLIHVIDKNSVNYLGDNTKEKATILLNNICQEIISKESINCESYIEEGCTCTIINSTAEKIDAFIVVLGTHGKSDIQFLSGLDTGKIIRKSRIPYFVVQKNTLSPNYQNGIILPIDFRKENKEKTSWVSFFAKYLKTDIKIFYPDSNDDSIKNNIQFCTKFFNDLSLTYEKVIVQSSLFNDLEKNAIKFAKNNNAFAIVILTTKNSSFFDKIFGFKEDKLISNKQNIPVLCINPRKDLYIPCV
ncbi:MAG: universal stress protein [Bacteroidales bacterium]|nr:universal stress protein [Bacteroidales bacterium]